MAEDVNEKIFKLLFYRGDVVGAEKLIRSGIGQRNLDKALLTCANFTVGDDLFDSKKRKQILNVLIECGANVNAKVAGGEKLPPLFCGDLEYKKLLIKNGADVNFVAEDGLTPLKLSVARQEIGAIRLFLASGAKDVIEGMSVNVKNKSKRKIALIFEEHLIRQMEAKAIAARTAIPENSNKQPRQTRSL